MNTIFIKPRQKAVLYNAEKNDVDVLESAYSDIDWSYVCPEDCEVRCTVKGTTTVLKAEKGDLILQFYDRPWIKSLVAVVKNKQWKDNMIAKLAYDAANRATDEKMAEFCNDAPAQSIHRG